MAVVFCRVCLSDLVADIFDYCESTKMEFITVVYSSAPVIIIYLQCHLTFDGTLYKTFIGLKRCPSMKASFNS